VEKGLGAERMGSFLNDLTAVVALARST